MGTATFASIFLSRKETPEEAPELLRNPDSPRKSFLYRRFSINQCKVLDPTNGLDSGKSLRRKKIVLDTDKPLEGVGLALVNLKILKTTIETLISFLKPLVDGADIAIGNARRPNCYVCTGGCRLTNEICRFEFEKFDKLIRAGGPMCILQAMERSRRFNPQSNGESVTAQCRSTCEHDHLHITNQHRLLLENMQSEVENVQILRRQVKYPNWSYCTGLGKFRENKSRNSQTVVDFTDFDKVRREYEWVWGSGWSIESWSDIEDACKDVLELPVTSIDEFNKRILIYSATHKTEDQFYRFNEKWLTTHRPHSMPISPRPKPSKKISRQDCYLCAEKAEAEIRVGGGVDGEVEEVEEGANVREKAREEKVGEEKVGERGEKKGGEEEEEEEKEAEGEEKEKEKDCVQEGGVGKQVNCGEVTSTGEDFRGLRYSIARSKRLMARKKGKQNSEVIVSVEEERELYKNIQPPPPQPLCVECEAEVSFEEAGRRVKAKAREAELYMETRSFTRYDEVLEAGVSI